MIHYVDYSRKKIYLSAPVSILETEEKRMAFFQYMRILAKSLQVVVVCPLWYYQLLHVKDESIFSVRFLDMFDSLMKGCHEMWLYGNAMDLLMRRDLTRAFMHDKEIRLVPKLSALFEKYKEEEDETDETDEAENSNPKDKLEENDENKM